MTEEAMPPNEAVPIDPTANVTSIISASNKRQDDLRDLNNRRSDAEAQHLREIMQLRADHAREIAALESKRIDAIRQVDVLAVNTAADRANAAIQALATTTTVNAETLRAMVASTATTIAAQTANTVGQITERIAALEKSSYEGVGRQRYSDPQMAEMVNELKSLRESRASVSGKGEGMSATWGTVAGVAALIVALMTLATFLLTHQAAR